MTLQPSPQPNIRRTPHGLYDLSYTFLVLPRLPQMLLPNDIQARLEYWFTTLAAAYEWQLQAVTVGADHVELSLIAPPSDSAEKIVRSLMYGTSDKILTEFPRLASENGLLAPRPGAFWSSGYCVITPGRRLTPAEVTGFIQYQRGE